jgi:hypothetical protein
VFNLVMGRGSVVGQAMLDSKDVAAQTFTGSVNTGRRVAEASVKQPAGRLDFGVVTDVPPHISKVGSATKHFSAILAPFMNS